MKEWICQFLYVENMLWYVLVCHCVWMVNIGVMTIRTPDISIFSSTMVLGMVLAEGRCGTSLGIIWAGWDAIKLYVKVHLFGISSWAVVSILLCLTGMHLWRGEYSPFMRFAQAQLCHRLIIVPLSTFHRLSELIGDPKGELIFLFNTARCGGTLLTRVLSAVLSRRNSKQVHK